MRWILFLFDVPKSRQVPEGTIRSKISRKLVEYPGLLPLQQSVYAMPDSKENEGVVTEIVNYFSSEFGEDAKLMVFKGESFLGFDDKHLEELAGSMLDRRFKGVERRAESLAKLYHKRGVTKQAAKRRLAKLLLKFEEFCNGDHREMHSTARLVAQQKMFELEKELTKE